MKSLFVDYAVTWQFTNLLCGSVPQNPDLIKPWLETRAPDVKPPEARDLTEIQEEVFETLSAPTEERKVSVLGFQHVDSFGLVVRGATIRAHLKDCARQLSRYVVGKVKGEASFAVRVVNTVYVVDEWVSVLKEGQMIRESEGWIEKPLSAMTPRGPISAFKRFAYVDQPTLVFTLRILGGAVGKKDLESLMQYGGLHGYAGERGMGYGRYLIERLEEK